MANKRASKDLIPEITFLTARSSGPGGQHVNKVESKVMLKWNIGNSKFFNELQKEMIRAANRTKVTKEDELLVTAEGQRSQLKNKEIALKKFDRLIAKSFVKKKPRIATSPTKAARKKRLDGKKRHGEKKSLRKRIL